MLFALLSILIAIATIDRCTRLARLDLLALSSRYKLFNLRDLLRQAATDGTVDANSWLFDYLDTSLSKAASQLMDLNLFELAYRATVGGEVTSMQVKALNMELNRKGNARFKAIHEGFQKCLFEFLVERHRGVGLVYCSSVTAALSSQHLWTKWKKRGKMAIVSSPRISTLDTYCEGNLRTVARMA